MDYQYWDHPTSGETYAIRISDGKVTGCVGPLAHHEITAANLPDYDYFSQESQDDAAWVAESQDAWTLHELEPVSRRYNIQIRVSKHERDTIRELAAGKGLTVSEYMRMMSIDAQHKEARA